MDDPRLAAGGGSALRKKSNWVLVLSYVFDWVIIIIGAAIGYVMGEVTPNMRPFSLTNPDISFPYTVNETVPVWLVVVTCVFAPAAIIAIICLVFVPGATVPPNTPKALIWKRKLWEIHAGLLGLALSIISAWVVTNGMKNLYGKPRPDLLSRCKPDMANWQEHVVGGFNDFNANGLLVSAKICTETDKHILDDGFRSYPSGHSSSSASGLIYLSLFIASKFAITLPFFAPGGAVHASALSAFPSRDIRGPVSKSVPETYELQTRGQPGSVSPPPIEKRIAQHNRTVAAVRRQAAAPPLYLLLIAIIPFFGAVFISSSRWFDFRHHGFDILFGFLIGTVSAFFAFRYYHLPISQGAGWAWGPRSPDKAFWAGVGSYSYATDRNRNDYRPGDEEEALDAVDPGYGRGTGTGLHNSHAPNPTPSRKGTADTEDGRDSRDPRFERTQQDTSYTGAVAI